MVTTVKHIRSNATYADIAENYAYLNTEFGLNLAMRRLGLTEQQIERIVGGRYKKGKYTGQLKGKLVWKKVVAGGWHKPFNCVIPVNITFAYRIESYLGTMLFPEYDSLNVNQVSAWENGCLRDELIKLGAKIKEQKSESKLETEQEKNKREFSENIEECRKATVTKESNEIWYNTLLKRYKKFNCEPLKEGETPEQFNDRICDALFDMIP